MDKRLPSISSPSRSNTVSRALGNSASTVNIRNDGVIDNAAHDGIRGVVLHCPTVQHA